jgi:pantothenate kinase
MEMAFPKAKIYKHDEMMSMVGGLTFILKNVKTPAFELRETKQEGPREQTEDQVMSEEKHLEPESPAKLIDQASNWTRIVPTTPIEFPTLLVSIGSGVSIIKVTSHDKYERVSGTMIGGGSLVGLSNLLTGIKDFDEIIKRA